MKICEFIKSIRKETGLTQAEFGMLVWPGDNLIVVRNRIAKYETDKAIPPGNILLKIQELKKSIADSTLTIEQSTQHPNKPGDDCPDNQGNKNYGENTDK